MAEMPMEEPAEAMEEPATGDVSQGYSIDISCLPDGSYQVSGPEPLAEEAAEETGAPGSEMGETFDSIGAALKEVLRIAKENPMGSDQASFEAGYSGAR